MVPDTAVLSADHSIAITSYSKSGIQLGLIPEAICHISSGSDSDSDSAGSSASVATSKERKALAKERT